MAEKLEVFDGKQTNWGGLWWQSDCMYFTSQTISLGQLRKFKGNVRLVVRKNRFYNNGENGRPNYVFLFRDAKSENPFEISVEEMTKKPYKEDDVYYTEDGERLYTREDARAIINGTVRDVEFGIHDPYDILPEDFV